MLLKSGGISSLESRKNITISNIFIACTLKPKPTNHEKVNCRNPCRGHLNLYLECNVFACGFLYDLLIALALCLAVSASSGGSFMKRFMICLAIGVAFACKGPLAQNNWMGYPSHYIVGDVWDCIMETAIAGAFISWWYGRK